MNIYSKNIRWKAFLLLIAISIGVGSLYYTRELVNDLAKEEKRKVKTWAEATRLIAETTCEGVDNFIADIIQNNETVPVILTDKNDNLLLSRNVKNEGKLSDTAYAAKIILSMKEQGYIIPIHVANNETQYLYYDKSTLLTKLTYYPYIQLGIILLFILVAYFAFNSSRNAEQNQVWVGLSKETAHQLGTPTSSLMAWVELLKTKEIEDKIIDELDKDVNRLKKITDRFSKIGSKPKMVESNIVDVLNTAVDYIRTRSSKRVEISVKTPDSELYIPLNIDLFEWVIENICKNAIDAMEGVGELSVSLVDNTQVVYIDISDTGKGIAKSKYKTIFKPGYTTKERGWGLGLSLSERIIENYHDGKIFVHSSEMNKGTRFRIVLKKFF